MLNIIVFSKNRGMQLELFLRSMKFYFKEFSQHKINILYNYTNEEFKKGYEKLFKIHNDENINYIKETQTFKSHILNLLDIKNPYTVFFVDDVVFKNSFTLNSKEFKLFTLKDEILALSLRLHPNLTYCYPANIKMVPPHFENNLSFKWYGLKGDYGYPMSLDGHFFRTNDIVSIAKILNFNNPNSFESMLSAFPLNRLKMICYEESIIINNPINKVQNYNNNIHGDIPAEFLNEKFLEGYIIDLDDFDGLKNISCHQEVEINLIKDETEN